MLGIYLNKWCSILVVKKYLSFCLIGIAAMEMRNKYANIRNE